jgi:essential nuclear protein 1
LWLTRPDEWSATATFACTRIFSSNLNVKMAQVLIFFLDVSISTQPHSLLLAQRFYSIVLLEKCREDIRSHNKLNYHLYMALKKALFKVFLHPLTILTLFFLIPCSLVHFTKGFYFLWLILELAV